MIGTHIAVHGLGYVGSVTAACLAKNGYRVTGVDIKEPKVEAVAGGASPVEEPGLDDLVADGVETGRLDATTDTTAAVREADLSFVCVGTPVDKTGDVDLDSVYSVARGLGESLSNAGEYHTVVIRSTTPPGTTENVTDVIAKASGRTPGTDFGVVANPEFIREGSAIEDFHDPPFVVLGTHHNRSTDAVLDVYETIGVMPSRIFPVEPAEAEILKYACNGFHATKVAFANEVGRICRAYGVDGRTVMEVFCQDRKLNISSQYLRPGFAFGGSCLHKDTRALAGFGDRDVPLIDAVLPANERHIRAAYERVVAADPDTVGVAGLAFKSGTDDVRNSPSLYLIRWLLNDGYDVVVYDPYVQSSELLGANGRFVEKLLPELDDLQVESFDSLVELVSYVVIGSDDSTYEPLADAEVTVLDPVGLFRDASLPDRRYDSLCW